MKLQVLYFLTLTSFVLYFGCDDSINANDIDNRDIPASNVSYSKDMAPVFELKCNSCHSGSRLEGGIDLSSWTGVVDPRILIPGASDASLLVWTVEKRPGYAPMPPLDAPFRPFTLKQINGLKTWIDEGAKNN